MSAHVHGAGYRRASAKGRHGLTTSSNQYLKQGRTEHKSTGKLNLNYNTFLLALFKNINIFFKNAN